MKKVNILIFVAFFVSWAVWFAHIPFAISPNVLNEFPSHKIITSFSFEYGIVFLLPFVICLIIFIVKNILDSKWQKYRLYRIPAAIMANAAFLFAWFSSFGGSLGFHCFYYNAFNCSDNPENPPCIDGFPIEIDIAYLLSALPMLSMLCLVLYFAFYNKILSRNNLAFFLFLVIINLIPIPISFNGNGIGCYD